MTEVNLRTVQQFAGYEPYGGMPAFRQDRLMPDWEEGAFGSCIHELR